MIRVKLPVTEKHVDEKAHRLVLTDREIEVMIDTSIYAEERWERHFPHNAKRETLFAYAERMRRSGLIKSRAHILSNLKAIYCLMEGDDIPDFKSFCQYFDLADSKRLKALTGKIKYIFDLILNSSAASPKN